MKKAFIKEDGKVLVAWAFLPLKKGTEVICHEKLSNGDYYIEIKKGTFKGRKIRVDSDFITFE